MKKIRNVGVVGAGTMGSAIAQKLVQEGFQVILADRDMSFVARGVEVIKTTFEEALQKKLFSTEQVQGYLDHLKGTDRLSDLKACDLIIEAIYEDFDAKSRLFKELSELVPEDTLIASNTSSFSITELASSVKHPERFIGLHFFYHVAKNRLVEIIPGLKTNKETVKAMHRFSVLSGKDPIYSRDAYGFVVNRFFVPWLNEAVRLYQEQVVPIPEIETVCKEVFGIGMGPFELMNVTGVPVAYHAEKTLERFGSLYKVADALEKQTKENQKWNLGNSGEAISNTQTPINQTQADNQIRDRMLGIVFFICSQLLDEKIATSAEIDKGARIGLRWKKGPVELMKELGEDEVMRLIVKIIDLYNMPLPLSIGMEYWQPTLVRLESKGNIAVITMDQPQNLNALSEETVKQLGWCFDQANKNTSVKTIFITGSGKAFVAGADINFFVQNMKKERLCDIESFTQFGQAVFERIDHSKKKVVAIINGLALGGGLELALCADLILAVPKAQMGFPETGIGIYPGLGGTQRSVKRIGKGLSKYLILTGKMLSAAEAEEIGLVDKIISFEELISILDGEEPVPIISTKKIPSHKWIALTDFFEENSLRNILDRNYSREGITFEDAEKLIKTIRFKAPVALRLADRLIDEAKGCASELEHLREIFSTSDALLGLTSIGERVTYEGK